MKISVNKTEFVISQVAELVTVLEELPREAELWLSTADDCPSICCLRTDGDALLMYLRKIGDSGFSARSDRPENEEKTFLLSNGQRDYYPANVTIPFTLAKKGLEYFFETQKMSPQIEWNED